jgi:hypothetical protein
MKIFTSAAMAAKRSDRRILGLGGIFQLRLGLLIRPKVAISYEKIAKTPHIRD